MGEHRVGWVAGGAQTPESQTVTVIRLSETRNVYEEHGMTDMGRSARELKSENLLITLIM